MKILQICPFFPESPHNAASGVVRVVFHISKELAKRGHEVTICTSSSTASTERNKQTLRPVNSEIVEGINVVRFSYSIAYYTFIVTPQIAPYMKKHLKDFDLVHLHDVRCFQSLVTHYYAKRYQIPYVLQPHGSYLANFKGNKLAWMLDHVRSRSIVRDSRRILVLNGTEAKYYERTGFPAPRIDIVGNGIDTKEYNGSVRGRFRQKFDVGTKKQIVLYVGRITESKGLDLLIDAFSILKEDVQAVSLVFAGRDEFGYGLKLKRQANDLNLENCVLLVGPVSEVDKINAYTDADVFVTPSFTGFPLTFLESCACGTPIITTRKGDVLDWIDDNVGYVTEYSKNTLARAMSNILTQERTRNRFENNCKIVKERFAWPSVVDQIEEIYIRATNAEKLNA